ncbi:hypothetical protein DFH28DRAFT_522232 [Melampsora americana]|nr:hypothetical protein DFH28DRAFT_522232 [Melampsora americana]
MDLIQTEDVKKEQKMIVLCGLVGSGKSTFANALVSFDSSFIRISQDVLGSRQECERLTKKSLREGLSVIIDRQNFDSKQRIKWIEIGEAFKLNYNSSFTINLIEFETSIDECSNRLNLRKDHETLKNVNEAQGILKLGLKNWVSPHSSEGYERYLKLYPVKEKDRMKGSDESICKHLITYPIEKSDLISILDLLESIPIIQNPLPRPSPSKGNDQAPRRGRGGGGGRGGARARGGGGARGGGYGNSL